MSARSFSLDTSVRFEAISVAHEPSRKLSGKFGQDDLEPTWKVRQNFRLVDVMPGMTLAAQEFGVRSISQPASLHHFHHERDRNAELTGLRITGLPSFNVASYALF